MPFKNPHPLYSCWLGMKNRCNNTNHQSYHRYGGRGIKVCDRWNDFHTFISDMGERPEGYSIDRIDNDKGYSPDNCRWATRSEQQLNRDNVRKVIIEGVEYIAHDLAIKSKLKTDTIIERVSKGLSLADVLRPEKMHNLSGLALGAGISSIKRKARKFCKRGHEFTYTKDGKKRCNICHAMRERERRANKT